MDHDEILKDAWKNQTGEWLDFAESYVLCTSFGPAGHSKSMEKNTGF